MLTWILTDKILLFLFRFSWGERRSRWRWYPRNWRWQGKQGTCRTSRTRGAKRGTRGCRNWWSRRTKRWVVLWSVGDRITRFHRISFPSAWCLSLLWDRVKIPLCCAKYIVRVFATLSENPSLRCSWTGQSVCAKAPRYLCNTAEYQNKLLGVVSQRFRLSATQATKILVAYR